MIMVISEEALWKLLKTLALTSAPLLASCGGSGNCGDRPTMMQVLPVFPADGGAGTDGGADAGDLLDARLDSCRADPSTCANLCYIVLRREVPGDWDVLACSLDDGASPSVKVRFWAHCIGGRAPATFSATSVPARLACDHLAEAARLEAASIDAFEILEGELRAHDAPASLRRRARRAAADERRHARTMNALARRYGASVEKLAVPRGPVRSLEAIAIENATEGCVRETWGAAVNFHQAAAAHDPVVRRAMAVIGADESRHAALAFAVDAWAQARLPRVAARRVQQARREAGAALLAGARREPPEALRLALGLPGSAQAVAMAAALGRSLWS